MSLICLQLDLARQKENIEYIKSYFENAKRWGYNTIVLYLENVVRTPSTSFFSEETTYSMEEMAEIVACAKEIGLDVIPAFENLAHLERFFAYPQLQDLAEWQGSSEQGRGFFNVPYANCGCISNERLYQTLDKYIAEVSSLFDGEYIHMGLDEPFDFAVCDKCKERLRNGESKADMFYRHVMHCYELSKKLGKRMMMWDDFFEYVDVVERLPRDIILCNWNYSFVGVEPSGHWTNRIKTDWFRLYDQLGFSYIFCTYAHGASSTYNLQSFTKYAEKYNPLGGLCTAWERADCFYLGSYPLMALSAKLWRGQVRNEKDIIDIYEEEIGDRNLARLTLSLQIPAFYGNYINVDTTCENEYFIKYTQRAMLSYAVDQMRQYLRTDVGRDIYNCAYQYLLDLQLSALGEDIFNQIEGGREDASRHLQTLKEIEKGFEEIQRDLQVFWKKYRKGIRSANNALEGKFIAKKSLIERIRKKLLQGEKCGIFYFDTMLHDGYCTVRAEIKVKYADEEKEISLYNGALKPSFSGYECGGCQGFRFRMKDERIDYALLSVYGEGGLYPLHTRYLAGGELYVAESVEIVSGNVINAKNLLTNDTQFVEMGNNDGKAHFNDIALCREKHTIKIKFKKLKERQIIYDKNTCYRQ